MLPNLFIPGAAKSGTSSLHLYLGQHPDIFMSRRKEPHFFSHDKRYLSSDGRKKYLDLFANTTEFQYRGESSTGYMVFPGVIERIKNEVEDPKFIFVLRNPVDRAYSHYWWLKGYGFENRDFKAAFLDDIHKDPDPLNTHHGWYKYYFQFGCYGKWISNFIEQFGSDKVLILTSEKLRTDPLGTVNCCFRFLGLRELSEVDQLQSNKTLVLKYPKRYHFLKNGYKKIYKALPKSLRRKFLALGIEEVFVNKVQNLAEKIGGRQPGYPKIGSDERRWIFEHYEKDLERLKATTGFDFPEWTEDFISS